MRVETRAIPLRRGDHSETSQVVHLLTEDHGRLVCLARGAHREGSAFGGPVDLLVIGRADLTLRGGEALALLHGFAVLRPLRGLRADPLRHAAACEMLEVVRALCWPRDPEGPWFELFAPALEALDEARMPETVEALLASFLGRAIGAAGFAPELDRCVACGKEADRPRGSVAFSDERGGVLCSGCARKERRPFVRLDPTTLGWIARLTGRSARGEEPLAAEALGRARRRLEEFLAHRLGARLRSPALLEERLRR